MRQRKKSWAEPFIKSHPELVLSSNEEEIHNLEEIFGRNAPLHVEIGVGKGDFLVAMARNHPHINFIGIEHQLSVLAIAAKKVMEENLSNIRFIQMDAAKLNLFLLPASISKIYLNFSDPWPKSRHEKRRLTSPYFKSLYELLLIPKGRIIMKTDNDSLYSYSLKEFQHSPWLLIEQVWDYKELTEGDYETEYEHRFRNLGQTIHRLVIEKGE